MSDTGTCPRCGDHSMMTPIEINALSRTTRGINDVAVWVCSDCGMDEGLEDYMLKEGATSQSEWPLEVSGGSHCRNGSVDRRRPETGACSPSILDFKSKIN